MNIGTYVSIGSFIYTYYKIISIILYITFKYNNTENIFWIYILIHDIYIKPRVFHI